MIVCVRERNGYRGEINGKKEGENGRSEIVLIIMQAVGVDNVEYGRFQSIK